MERSQHQQRIRTFSINLPFPLYEKLLSKAGKGRVSTFIKQLLEERLITEEQNQKEQLKQQLITSHKRVAQNQKLKKELAVWDETVDDYINKDDGKN